jgi:Icc protein
MKHLFYRCLITAAIISITISCNHQQSPAEKPSGEFSFVFMTDIHVQREKNAISGFRKAIVKVNELKPSFVITGGDLVMDALGVSYGRADSLYNIYSSMQTEFNMPVFNTLGNHEIYGWYASSGADTTHPEYGKKMFEKRIGPRYQRIDRNGWIFLILDSVQKNGKGGYEGGIDAEQFGWLKDQLADIPAETPIAISTHIPLMTVGGQVYYDATTANAPGLVVVNGKEVRELFRDHNLKLVLQGHLHYFESIKVFGTEYITAGSVAGEWWEGTYMDTEEGFLLLKVKGEDVDWEYVDYGWDVTL